MTRQSAVVVAIYLVTSLGLTGLSRVLDERLKTETGLIQSVELGIDDEHTPLFTRTTSDIDLAFLDDPELPRRFFEVRWDGLWHVPEDLQVDVYAGADDSVSVRIDDELVLERSPEAGMYTTSERITLDAGLHRLSVHYVQRGGGYYLNVQWAPAEGRPRSFDPERLFPARPLPDQITRNQQLLLFRRLVTAIWIAPPLVYLLWIGPAVVRFSRYRLPGVARGVWLSCCSMAVRRWASASRDPRARQKTWTVVGALGVVLLFILSLSVGNTADVLAHAVRIAHGVGASLAFAACLHFGGSALIPRRWDASFRVGESPAVLAAALYVLLCWFGIQFGIPVRTVAIGCAIAVLAAVGVRHRWFRGILRSRAARDHAAGWVIGFCLLYVLAYLFTMPPATDEYLPLAWSGNVDLLNYLTYTRHLLDLEPSNHVGFGYLDDRYLQTPAVFYLLGGFSLLFGPDLMSAVMPVQFAVTALIGVLVARVSHAVFGMSVAAALVIGGVLISGPFFRYVSAGYFLSTLMSTPILLYLLWTTVAYRPQHWLDAPLAIRFGSAYVLLLIIYPFLFFVGLAAQMGAVVLMFGADLQPGEGIWSSWRDAGRKTGRTMCAILAPLGVLVLVLRQRLEWALDMVLSLSQPGVAGWPLDVISPLALLGLPGTLADGGQVESPAERAWAIGIFCTIAAMLGLLYSGRFRQRTTPAQRTFAGLAGVFFISYCGYFLVVGQSYQQWKLASYSALPFSFVVLATGACLFRQSGVFARVTRTALGCLGAQLAISVNNCPPPRDPRSRMTSFKRAQRKYVQKAYRVRNWREYETGLRARGSLTVWLGLTDGKLANWNSPRPTRRKPGRQRKYSNHAIETTVTVGLVFGLASRQTEGFLRSLLTLLNLDNDVPDHSTISRRKARLGKGASYERRTVKPVHLLIDSSGLSVHVGQLRTPPKARDYRKLHLAVDEHTSDVVACELTSKRARDASRVASLVGQIERPIASAKADAAYDTGDVYKTLENHRAHRSPKVLIPPRKGAQLALDSAGTRQRNRNIRARSRVGKRKWYVASGYSRRSKVETTFHRYKAILGSAMRARGLASQRVEVRLGCKILNTMTALGIPDGEMIG